MRAVSWIVRSPAVPRSGVTVSQSGADPPAVTVRLQSTLTVKGIETFRLSMVPSDQSVRSTVSLGSGEGESAESFLLHPAVVNSRGRIKNNNLLM